MQLLLRLMRSRPTVAFDHGAALRVPPAHDARSWRLLMQWLGEAGRALPAPGAVEVSTAQGSCVAMPGDWIVLAVTGDFHVGVTGDRRG